VLLLSTTRIRQALRSPHAKIQAGSKVHPAAGAVRAHFYERLEWNRRAWEETHDPLAVAEAITWTYHFRLPIEEWLEEAVVQVAIRTRSPERAKKHRADMANLQCYTMVRDFQKHDGLTWDEAKAQAVKCLAHLGRHLTKDGVWKAYQKVKRQLRAGHGGRYWNLKDIRYRDQATAPKKKAL
jgi:hypothetical protein